MRISSLCCSLVSFRVATCIALIPAIQRRSITLSPM
nr:MAG TPA: hypothetical protein [Caudoviricetes sp.]